MFDSSPKKRPVPSRLDLLKACDVMRDMVSAVGSARMNRAAAAAEAIEAAAIFAQGVKDYLTETVLAEAMVASQRVAPEVPEAPRTSPSPPPDAPDEDVLEAKPGKADCFVCAGKGVAPKVVDDDGAIAEQPCPMCFPPVAPVLEDVVDEGPSSVLEDA